MSDKERKRDRRNVTAGERDGDEGRGRKVRIRVEKWK